MTSSQSGTDTNLSFIEFEQSSTQTPSLSSPSNATEESKRVSFRIPNCLSRFVTEFIVTEDWYIVFSSPLSLNLERLATLYMASVMISRL